MLKTKCSVCGNSAWVHDQSDLHVCSNCGSQVFISDEGRIKDPHHLMTLVIQKKSVIGFGNMKPMPAAFIVQMRFLDVMRIILSGLYVYEKGKK